MSQDENKADRHEILAIDALILLDVKMAGSS